MSTATLNSEKYKALLIEALPVTIHTEAEHRRLLKVVATLTERPDEEMSQEEGRLLELLSILIEDYETRNHPLPETEPHKMLAFLLEEKGMKARDLWDILPKSRVSEILSGKRSISKAQARNLAERFRVPVELFL